MQQFGLVENCSLQSWSVIGSGGFGQIYKAKHKVLRIEVAIKLLHHDDGGSLLKEAEFMRQGGSPYVVQVFGVYRGVPPGRGSSPQMGLVMELVERGSVESLMQRLKGPPPWPLAFRLAHEVALGMNFLHHLSPPLLHLDLKPSNVLLDYGFRAKLTDFGLARLMRSISSVGGQGEEGGTLSYMPPEAFELSYKHTPASDSYSYAILLWSIITGRQPYRDVRSCLVRLRIPLGDRPSLDGVDREAVEGLGKIIDLMVTCWDPSPQKRPPFHDCLPVSEEVFELHKCGINDAIHQVSTKLDEESELSSSCSRIKALSISASPMHNGTLPAQETTGDFTSHSKVKGSAPHHPIRMMSDDPSLHPAKQTPMAACSSTNQSRERLSMGQTPVLCSKGNVGIHVSNVNAVQIGDNNSMTITTGNRTRRRNPTAPASVNLPAQQPGKPFQ
ncbi:hypothetical protein SKAU_G00032960 [Synaphobranchus kaupii]|uniref:Protein kinase domain-containing protein n=1 Tax=Synaphobranchus kaupii TaxID=118154 RepID=A0A9Q1GFA8_SYNKA|nr:hypothetical protein SKAU_G00032960 [Synaphobranchus kaupii]